MSSTHYYIKCFMFPKGGEIDIDNYHVDGMHTIVPERVFRGSKYYVSNFESSSCRESTLYYYNCFRKDYKGHYNSAEHEVYIQIDFKVSSSEEWFNYIRGIFCDNLDIRFKRELNYNHIFMVFHSFNDLNIAQFSLVSFLLSRYELEKAVAGDLSNTKYLVDFMKEEYEDIFADDLSSHRYSNAAWTAFAIVSFISGLYTFEDKEFYYRDGLGVVRDIEQLAIKNIGSDLFKSMIEFVNTHRMESCEIKTPSHPTLASLGYIIDHNRDSASW